MNLIQKSDIGYSFLTESSSEHLLSPLQNEIASLISFINSTSSFSPLKHSAVELLEALLQEVRFAPMEDQEIYEAVAIQILFLSESPHFYQEWWNYFTQIASVESQSYFSQFIKSENDFLFGLSSRYTQDGAYLILDHQRRIYVPDSVIQKIVLFSKESDPAVRLEILHALSDKKFSKKERLFLEESMKKIIDSDQGLLEELFSAWFLCIKKHMLPYSPFVVEHSVPLLNSTLSIENRYSLLLFILTCNPDFSPSKNPQASSLMITLHHENKIFSLMKAINQTKTARQDPYYSLIIWKEVCTILIEELKEIPITYLEKIQSQFSCPEMGEIILELIDKGIPSESPFFIEDPTSLSEIYLNAHQWHKQSDSDLGWRLIGAVSQTISTELLNALIRTLPKSLPTKYSRLTIFSVLEISTSLYNQFFQNILDTIDDCSLLIEHMEPLLLCFSKYKHRQSAHTQNKIIDFLNLLLKNETLPFNQLTESFENLYVFLKQDNPEQILPLLDQFIKNPSFLEENLTPVNWVNNATTLALKKQTLECWEHYTNILTHLIKNKHTELAEKFLEKIVPNLSKHLLPYVEDLIYLLFDQIDENKKTWLFLFYKKYLPNLSYPEFNLVHFNHEFPSHRELLLNSLSALELSEEHWIYLFDIAQTLPQKQRLLIWNNFSTSPFFNQPTKFLIKKICTLIKVKLLNSKTPHYTDFLSNLLKQFNKKEPWTLSPLLLHINYYPLKLDHYRKLSLLVSETQNPKFIQKFFKSTLNNLYNHRKIPEETIATMVSEHFLLVEDRSLVLKLACLINKELFKKLILMASQCTVSLEKVEWYKAAILITDSLKFLLQLNTLILEEFKQKILTGEQVSELIFLVLDRTTTLFPADELGPQQIFQCIYLGITSYNQIISIGDDQLTKAVFMFYFNYGLKFSIQDPSECPIEKYLESVNKMLESVENPTLKNELKHIVSFMILQNSLDIKKNNNL